MFIAIVTGASSGMGKECAIQLANENIYDEIWLIARREDRLKETAAQLATSTRLFTLNLEKINFIEEIETILKEFHPTIGIVVNAAGFGLNGDFSDLSQSEQLQMIDLNCRAAVALTHLVIPYMQRRSRFINISSIAGEAPLGAFAIYGATKSFLTSFSIGIASELKPLGISMTVVLPGSVETEFQSRARGKDGRKKKLFAKKATAKAVIKKALADSQKGKLLSYYGITPHLAGIIGKIFTPYQSARFAYTKIYPAPKKS